MGEDVLICRCKEVTEQEIRQAIAEGAYSVIGIKRRTGAGMGLCQGRTCQRLIVNILSGLTGIPAHVIDRDTPRPPVRPVKATILLSLCESADAGSYKGE
jgi:bacterioferritin-associated ferredoxin